MRRICYRTERKKRYRAIWNHIIRVSVSDLKRKNYANLNAKF